MTDEEPVRSMIKHIMNSEGVSYNQARSMLDIPRERKTEGRDRQAVALMKLEGIKYTEALRRVRTEREQQDKQEEACIGSASSEQERSTSP